MRRREFLAAALPLLVVGCSQTDDESTPPNTPTRTPTPAPTATPTDAPTETETPSAEGTETPTAEEIERARQTAVDDLEATYGAYVEQADASDPTLLDVSLARDSFDAGAVVAAADRAERAIDTLDGYGEAVDPTTVDRLRSLATFLAEAARAEAALVAAYDPLEVAVGNYLSGEYDAGYRSLAMEHAERATTHLEKVAAESHASDTEAVEFVDEEEYIDKRGQLHDRRDVAVTVTEWLAGYEVGQDLLASGRRALERGNDERAVEDAEEAADLFADVLDEAEDLTVPEAFEERYETLVDAVEAALEDARTVGDEAEEADG